MEQPFKLVIYSHQGSKLPIGLYLKHGLNTIGSGRMASCQIKLKDVSDLHCKVTIAADDMLLEDMGSVVGTYLDRGGRKEKVEESQKLEEGQMFYIGRCKAEVVRIIGSTQL